MGVDETADGRRVHVTFLVGQGVVLGVRRRPVHNGSLPRHAPQGQHNGLQNRMRLERFVNNKAVIAKSDTILREYDANNAHDDIGRRNHALERKNNAVDRSQGWYDQQD